MLEPMGSGTGSHEHLVAGVDHTDGRPLRVAAVQAASVYLDAERTALKVCRLIEDAAGVGAKVAVFPESFLPGHPGWFHFHPVTAPQTAELNLRLLRNAITIPGPEVAQVCDAARRHRVFVILGVTERPAETRGTMYNTQIHIDCEGRIVAKHQKLVPTLGERLVHAPGSAATFGALNTQAGVVSSLVCGENANPLALFAIAVDYPRLHAMSWPPHFNRKLSHPHEHIRFISQYFANSAKCFVISAAAVIDDSLVDAYEIDHDAAELTFLRDKSSTGGSIIVDPNGRILSAASSHAEEIIFADLDLDDCDRGKLVQDYVGHYNRSDIFNLSIDTRPRNIVDRLCSSSFVPPTPTDSNAELGSKDPERKSDS